MHTFDGKEYATDDELVAAMAATLELPPGLVSATQLNQWQDGLDARGWTHVERTDNHYRLRHAASDFLADLQLLRYDPDDPDHPVMDDAAGDDRLRSAFGTVRLSAPSDHGLIADANLIQAGHGGAVTWLITHIEPTNEEAADSATTASPFAGASDDATTSSAQPALVGVTASVSQPTQAAPFPSPDAAQPLPDSTATGGEPQSPGEPAPRTRDVLSIAIMLVTFLLVGMTAWVALQRSRQKS